VIPLWLQATTRVLSSRRIGVIAGATIAVLLVAAAWRLPISAACWFSLSVIVATGALIAASEPPRARLVSINLFTGALALRVLVLVLFYALAVGEGGPFLGPDSSGYFEGANELVALGFHLDTIPLLFFGSYDVGHYYLFAAAIRLHADLFALQLLNVGFTALAAPLAYAIGRRTVPRAARIIGLLVALSPSLVVLAAIDLLKDPSVVCATLLAIVCILRLARARTSWTVLLAAAVSLVPLLYLRTSRFYSFAYLEAATIAALIWIALWRRRLALRTWTAAAALVVVFGVTEAVPMRAGWPSSPVLILAQVGHVLGTPSMRFYSVGLFERFRHRRAPEEPEAQTPLEYAANLFRRIYGPFPWILPDKWNLRFLQSADYLLYPGMLLWYGLLPFVVIGLTHVGRAVASRASESFGLVFLWLFTAIYFLQYLAINVSYRQREAMFPVLVVFGCIGWAHARRGGQMPRWYVAYWAGLGGLAAAHLALRAWMAA
jgi:hypothetical protein